MVWWEWAIWAGVGVWAVVFWALLRAASRPAPTPRASVEDEAQRLWRAAHSEIEADRAAYRATVRRLTLPKREREVAEILDDAQF